MDETIKWGFPSFDYKGPFLQNGRIQAACGVWILEKQAAERPQGLYLKDRSIDGGEAMGNLGRITTLEDSSVEAL